MVFNFKTYGGGPGYWPETGLVALGGELYGTTIFGAAHNDGTVFALTPP